MMFSRLLQVAFAIILAEAANGASYRSGKNNRDLIKAEKNFRDGKIFSFFNIVRFENGPCLANSLRNGTCFTTSECDEKGGVNGGPCAQGFGACCLFSIQCGETSVQNNTYFDSGSLVQAGSCGATICRIDNDICQLKLEFDNFVISGPSTGTVTVTSRVARSGVVANGGTVPVCDFTRCMTDTFSVTNPGGARPPTICGTNTKEHMYVEASSMCNNLFFELGMTGVGTPLAARSWSIKVSQYECAGDTNLAPRGCVQFFYGKNSGKVRSFNYNSGNGLHLADQRQSICVRRERANCRICWTDVLPEDFALTGGQPGNANPVNIGADGRCCSYDNPDSGRDGFDCVQIPGAVNDGVSPVNPAGMNNDIPVAPNRLPRQSCLCGNRMGLPGRTVCSTLAPFILNFRSDSFDTATEASQGGEAGNRGFELVFFMDAIGC